MALPGDQALKYTSLWWPFLFKPPDKHKHLLDSVIENYNQEDNLSPKKKKKGVWELTKSNVTGCKGDKIEDRNPVTARNNKNCASPFTSDSENS